MVNHSFSIIDQLATISMSQYTSRDLLTCLCAMIRMTVYPSSGEISVKLFKTIHIMSRMCYEIISQTGDVVYLTNLSKEDVDVLYGLRLREEGMGSLQNLLNEVRFAVRPSGPVDMLEADRMAKDLVTVMES